MVILDKMNIVQDYFSNVKAYNIKKKIDEDIDGARKYLKIGNEINKKDKIAKKNVKGVDVPGKGGKRGRSSWDGSCSILKWMNLF